MSNANALSLRRYTANLYFSETKYEILKQSRNRMYAFATLAFPLMFYGLFGLTNKKSNNGLGVRARAYRKEYVRHSSMRVIHGEQEIVS